MNADDVRASGALMYPLVSLYIRISCPQPKRPGTANRTVWFPPRSVRESVNGVVESGRMCTPDCSLTFSSLSHTHAHLCYYPSEGLSLTNLLSRKSVLFGLHQDAHSGFNPQTSNTPTHTHRHTFVLLYL